MNNVINIGICGEIINPQYDMTLSGSYLLLIHFRFLIANVFIYCPPVHFFLTFHR